MKPELLVSLKGYKKKYLLNDVMSGLLVAIIALPLSIALGIQSVPSEVSANGIQLGIITAIVAGFLISFAGGSRFQIGGPTAAFVVILYNYICNPSIGILGLQFATILAGIWLILLGLFKAGNIMEYMPYPIVIGFTTGVGITLLIGQFKDFFGLIATGSDVIEKVISYVENISSFNWFTFMIGAIGLTIIIVIQKVNRKIPGAFIALIVCTVITLILNATYGDLGIATIGSKYGNIKADFYFMNFDGIANIKFSKLIVPSFVIAFLCMVESLLSATVADGMAKTKHNSNQELLGQGFANICSSLFGGLPATGAIARTAANINSGAKSSLAGLFHAIFILIMYFALMGVVKFIPLAAFAAILISVAINMSNIPLFVKLLKFGRRDSFILVVTCLLTVLLDLTYGVIGGVIITVIVNIPNIIKKMSVEILEIDGKTVNKVRGAIYFMSATKLVEFLTKSSENKKEVIVDLSEVNNIDETSVEKLACLYKEMESTGKTVSIVNCNTSTQKRIDKYFCILEK